MIRRAGALAFLLLPSGTGTASAQIARNGHASELDRHIEKPRTEWQVPGVAVAVVRGDEIVFARGFGHLRSDRPEPVTENSLFAIGSSSKAFTAVALGMTRTSTRVGDMDRDPDVAIPRALRREVMVPVEYRRIDNVGPAGSINSSAVDMAQWVRLHGVP